MKAKNIYNKYGIKEHLQPYVMLLPSLIGMALFVVYPMLWVLSLCLFRYDGIRPAEFIGFYHFIRIFTRDPRYWTAVVNTFILSIGKLSIELPLALVLAYILDKKFRFRSLFRTIFFLPTIISVAIVGVIFYFIFATYDGIVNGLLLKLHLISRPIDWFGSKWTAMFAIGATSIWQNFGLVMIFFLTGLQSIPKEVYDSAEIDGAAELQKFFRITIPMLGPVLQVVVMIALLGSLKVTDLVLVLTRGGPAGKTNVMMSYVYYEFFSSNIGTNAAYGYGAAVAVVTSIILGIVTVLYLRYTRKSSALY